MHRQVVEDDDIARSQRRHQDLLDVGEKCRIVDRAIEDGSRREVVDAQAGDYGVGLLMAVRRVIAESHAARTPSVAPQEIGGDAGFVNEDVKRGRRAATACPASAGAVSYTHLTLPE